MAPAQAGDSGSGSCAKRPTVRVTLPCLTQSGTRFCWSTWPRTSQAPLGCRRCRSTGGAVGSGEIDTGAAVSCLQGEDDQLEVAIDVAGGLVEHGLRTPRRPRPGPPAGATVVNEPGWASDAQQGRDALVALFGIAATVSRQTHGSCPGRVALRRLSSTSVEEHDERLQDAPPGRR